MASPNTTSELDSVALETGLLSTWQEEKLFDLSVDNRADGEPFIFLEGPPTARPTLPGRVPVSYTHLTLPTTPYV